MSNSTRTISNLATQNEHNLIQQASTLGKVIREFPIEKLKPFASQIRMLSSTFTTVSEMIQAQSLPAGSLADANFNHYHTEEFDNQEASKTCLQLTSVITHNEQACPHQKAVNRLLMATNNILPDIMEVAWGLKDILKTQIPLSPRILHIQGVYMFQKRRPSRSADARERVLFIGACKSFAQDFSDFETRHGWEPKSSQVAKRILQGEDPSIQRIGKHFKQFIKAEGLGLPVEEPSDIARFDAALRFGIKLEVLDILGQAMGLGRCLSLVFGFECVKFTRLSYGSFGRLQETLKCEGMIRESIGKIDALFSQQWTRYIKEYHHRYAYRSVAQEVRPLDSHALIESTAVSADGEADTDNLLNLSDTVMDLSGYFDPNADLNYLLGIDYRQ